MTQAYCATRISPHMAKDVNGNLICLAAPIMRSGYYTYKVSEVDRSSDDDSDIDIFRPVSEVTSAATVASAEGAALTRGHPAQFVTPETHSWTAMGHAQNVRVGPKDKDGNVQLVGDLHIKDKSLIEAIERGVRDLSCGFTYSLVQLSNGDWAQTDLRINHIAVVEDGRAGTSKIMDSRRGTMTKAKDSKLGQVLDALDRFVKKYSGKDAECNCGGKKQHSDQCPQYQQADDGLQDEPVLNSEKSSEAERKGAIVSHDDIDLEEVGKSVGSAVLGLAGAVAGDEEPEAEYERAGKSEQEKPDTLGAEVIPVSSEGGEGNVNPVSARDARAALKDLYNPALRAVVKDQGRRAIDAYNRAVRALRQQIAISERYETRLASDSRFRRQTEAADFETRAARFHGKAIKLHRDPNSVDDDAEQRQGIDRQPRLLQGEEAAADFEQSVAKMHRKEIKR